jgi:hypothetical protein
MSVKIEKRKATDLGPGSISPTAVEADVSPYAGTPGRGPEGRTCRRCDCLQIGRIGRAEKKHPFCRLVADRMGPMFDGDRPKIWTGTKACEHYRPISGLGYLG